VRLELFLLKEAMEAVIVRQNSWFFQPRANQGWTSSVLQHRELQPMRLCDSSSTGVEQDLELVPVAAVQADDRSCNTE
jgi:hypothetical protein